MHWTLADFRALTRPEQVAGILYAMERDLEELERAGGMFGNAEPENDPDDISDLMARAKREEQDRQRGRR